MALDARTPVEVWAPAWRWLDDRDYSPRRLLSLRIDHGEHLGLFCLLCEGIVRVGSANEAAHIAEHRRELREWRRKERAAVRRANVARLREVNRERRLTRRALG